MPIEIKEISIKAAIYPTKNSEDNVGNARISAEQIEHLKKEITREVTQAVLQKIQQTIER